MVRFYSHESENEGSFPQGCHVVVLYFTGATALKKL
jgi:hypothetical protein